MSVTPRMTDASAGEWHRHVWRLAGPIILSNVSVPLLGIVDTTVVGHLPGPQYIGAVAIGAMIFSVVYIGFNFLRMGTTGITAQALGAKDADEVRATLARAVIVAVVLGAGLVVVQRPIAWIAFPLVDAQADVAGLADAYYSIRVWGAPAALANFAFLGWFIGIQNTRAALILQIAMNGINIVLDLWFVLGLGLGVEGVAYATLISEVGAVALGVWLMWRGLPAIGGAWRGARIMDVARARRLFAINRDIFIRTVCLMLSFAVFTALGARLGVTVLAANAVLMNLQVFMAYALDGFAFAVESLAGAALGGRDSRAFRAAVRVTTIWALVFSVCFTAFYGLIGGYVIDAITDIAEVREVARLYLPWAVVAPLISVWSFQLDGIFTGATRGADMRNTMVISAAVYGLALVVLVPPFGNHGLWLAFMVLMVVRAITLGVRYPAIVRDLEGTDL